MTQTPEPANPVPPVWSAGPPPYGAPQYGAPQYGAPYQPWHAPVRQSPPGPVMAAAILTWIGAGLSAAMTLFMAVAGVFVGSVIIANFEGRDAAEIALAFIVSAVISLTVAGLACWFAWQTWRRKAWARYALAAICVLTMAGSAMVIASPLALSFVGAAAVMILLFVPATTAWFRDADRTTTST